MKKTRLEIRILFSIIALGAISVVALATSAPGNDNGGLVMPLIATIVFSIIFVILKKTILHFCKRI